MIRVFWAILVSASLLAAEKEAKEAPPYEDLVIQAREAERKGLLGKALEFLEKAKTLDPKRLDAYFFAGRILTTQRKSEDAIAAFDKVIKIQPKASTAYQMRGQEYFKLGRVEKSIEDFNQYLKLEPQREPEHWQRGISYYYAKKFVEGRKQFELHQTVNPNDVENGVWHFLCVAGQEGFEAAQKVMMPIKGDRRVPMTEVYELFAGKIKTDDVLSAVNKGSPSPEELDNRNFYAHLYLGLYYEALKDGPKAFEHIKKAATEFPSEHYMGDVARVHLQRLLAK